MHPVDTIQAFDEFLAARKLQLKAVIIGGTALNLIGVVSRTTKDCDVLSPVLPAEIVEAARDFASETRRNGITLQDDWLNNGPSSLVPLLPRGWELRLQLAFVGKAIQFDVLGRIDLLRSKLFALCDRGIDLGDCIALSPTADELSILLPWIETQDGNPAWQIHVRATLDDLAKRLGHGI